MKARSRIQLAVGIVWVGLGLGAGPGRADILTWTAGTNEWHAVGNWTNWAEPASTRVPADGDVAVVTNSGARVLLTQSSAFLSALVISNATVSCSNWVTTLYATNLTILKGGVLTCEGPFTNSVMSNRVCLVCSTLVIEAGGAITVDGKGYAGGAGGYGSGNGPGGGGKPSGPWYGNDSNMFGGSYGGAGRNGRLATPYGLTACLSYVGWLATNTYGSAAAPLDPGSGGLGPNQTVAGNMGGSGGGAVRITAVQAVVNGRVSANGTQPVGISHGAGGSGGGIYITCSTLAGTNGAITADAGLSGGGYGGGGGGGRIAVAYDPEAQRALPVPSIRFSVAPTPSGGQSTTLPGDIGTLWFSDSAFFSPANLFNGQWMAPGLTDLSLSDWTVSNVWLRLPGINLTVTNTLAVTGTNYTWCKLEFADAATVRCGQATVSGASFGLGGSCLEYYPTARNPYSDDEAGSSLTVAGDLILTNGAQFYVFAGMTNAAAPAEFGARIDVGNDFLIATNCWVFPAAHPTNGAVPVFSMRNLKVGRGGGFNADAQGYSGGIGYSAIAYGPGRPSKQTHGAGYGGAGAPGYGPSGGTPGGIYGSPDAPTAPGSGASGPPNLNLNGAWGGGSVRICADKAVSLDGAITANGGSGVANYGGGASGGGIFITCRTFTGSSSALLQANGGGGSNPINKYGGGGGGGGRIAVWRVRDFSTSQISNSVSGGFGWLENQGTNAASGTVVWGWLPEEGTLIRFQ